MNAIAYPKGTVKALSRSLRIYHGDKQRNAAMDRLYGTFLAPGDLAFDIGAHVGDRISSFRRLGARVVALEPQPGPARVVRLIHRRDPLVTLIEAACGDHEGSIALKINSANPTVSTASAAFIGAAVGARGWEGQVWDHEITVPCTTLDRLILRHGLPRLLKIDVEGFEAHVLAGLTKAVPVISFEFTTIQREVAEACIALLETLGPYRFNVAIGESQQLELAAPASADAMGDYLRGLPHAANSGDVYAILQS
ncbi:FkbM family methyltransferase [Bosea sp. NBC_00550]|jgi:FkbM family methyltransferase|uniref:FkbM family methyltransferase n=1 Tax=Bosea sp. NBC_00550 TaxID=2969621 RepID=UPI0022318D8A|nr:FkbM family methyltransferase [Bosea sp. NBC_00550]UZF94763.1 FkbM family methyltransferase [Bosea sp. NBC_00550]